MEIDENPSFVKFKTSIYSVYFPLPRLMTLPSVFLADIDGRCLTYHHIIPPSTSLVHWIDSPPASPSPPCFSQLITTSSYIMSPYSGPPQPHLHFIGPQDVNHQAARSLHLQRRLFGTAVKGLSHLLRHARAWVPKHWMKIDQKTPLVSIQIEISAIMSYYVLMFVGETSEKHWNLVALAVRMECLSIIH